MKLRMRIWMLPLCAAAVFTIGAVVSYVVGARTSADLRQLRDVQQPLVTHMQRIDRGVEQFRLTLQFAASEGDVEKLKEVRAVVDRTRLELDAMGGLHAQSAAAARLREAFDAYQALALSAAKAMLERQDPGDLVARMQAAQNTLDALLKDSGAAAERAAQAQLQAADHGVRTALWANVFTGLAVLCLLGLVSRLIVSAVWRELGDEPATLLSLTRRIADGDLLAQPQVAPGDTRSLNAGLAVMVEHLRETVGTIRVAADSIGTASDDIASGSTDLSHRTETTVSNLRATASSVVELTDGVKQTASAAEVASAQATEATAAAERGGDIVSRVVHSMGEINAASSKIAEIIGVIDGIAFQTNILALNAAVEAARAGAQGRGFAVVAGEVRTLAQRSAQAAREIKGLIGASNDRVESGTRLVRDAGEAMQQIVHGVRSVTQIIGEISAAAQRQSGGIEQVNHAVSALDRMTQQNAALVEQSAAAVSSMRQQASSLAQAVAVFRSSQGA